MKRNPNSRKFQLPDGYTDLGWQKHSGECKEIADALAKGYKIREFDNSPYGHRCTDVVYIIDKAKIVWHINYVELGMVVNIKQLNLGNPLRNLVGQPFYSKKPSDKKILEELLKGMAEFKGTCWNPVSINGGYDLMLNQCPQACGEVWRINIKDKVVADWLVNEINQRRQKTY